MHMLTKSLPILISVGSNFGGMAANYRSPGRRTPTRADRVSKRKNPVVRRATIREKKNYSKDALLGEIVQMNSFSKIPIILFLYILNFQLSHKNGNY